MCSVGILGGVESGPAALPDSGTFPEAALLNAVLYGNVMVFPQMSTDLCIPFYCFVATKNEVSSVRTWVLCTAMTLNYNCSNIVIEHHGLH